MQYIIFITEVMYSTRYYRDRSLQQSMVIDYDQETIIIFYMSLKNI